MPRFWFGAIFSSTPAATTRDLPQSSSLLTIFVIADSLSWFRGRIPASSTNKACSFFPQPHRMARFHVKRRIKNSGLLPDAKSELFSVNAQVLRTVETS
jgi:hypothetical protein